MRFLILFCLLFLFSSAAEAIRFPFQKNSDGQNHEAQPSSPEIYDSNEAPEPPFNTPEQNAGDRFSARRQTQQEQAEVARQACAHLNFISDCINAQKTYFDLCQQTNGQLMPGSSAAYNLNRTCGQISVEVAEICSREALQIASLFSDGCHKARQAYIANCHYKDDHTLYPGSTFTCGAVLQALNYSTMICSTQEIKNPPSFWVPFKS